MGFKCPICMEDFGKNKQLWKEHCKKKHLGAAEIIVESIETICGDKNKKEVKKGTGPDQQS